MAWVAVLWGNFTGIRWALCVLFWCGFGLVCGFILGLECRVSFVFWAYPNSPFYRVLLFLVSVFGVFYFCLFFPIALKDF